MLMPVPVSATTWEAPAKSSAISRICDCVCGVFVLYTRIKSF
ncbi:hypothetical protein DFAR_450004 [Desulfarculales bacterium]